MKEKRVIMKYNRQLEYFQKAVEYACKHNKKYWRTKIEEKSSYDYNRQKYDINMSSIATELIHNVGRWVENYASDFLIDWAGITKLLESEENEYDEVFWFGLRESGVDGYSYIYSQFENNHGMNYNYYRKIYALRMKAFNNELTATLVDVTHDVIYKAHAMPRELAILPEGYDSEITVPMIYDVTETELCGMIQFDDKSYISVVSDKMKTIVTHWKPTDKDDSKYESQIEVRCHKDAEIAIRDIIEKQLQEQNVKVVTYDLCSSSQ